MHLEVQITFLIKMNKYTIFYVTEHSHLLFVDALFKGIKSRKCANENYCLKTNQKSSLFRHQPDQKRPYKSQLDFHSLKKSSACDIKDKKQNVVPSPNYFVLGNTERHFE